MIARLFQRAGAIGAASVALFVSLIAPVHASTAAQVNVYGVDTVRNADGAFEARYHFQRRFAANDPVYPGKVDYVTRRVKVPKRGNPVKWFKRNPMEYAAWAAAAAAGYAIDELTGQVTRQVATPDPSYDPNFYYYTGVDGGDYNEPTLSALSSVIPQSRVIGGVEYKDPDCRYTSASRIECVYTAENGAVSTPNAYKMSCATEPHAICGAPAPPLISNEPVPYEELWTVLDPVADAAPDHHLSPWVKDAAGNPYIYPEVQAEQAKIAEGVPGAQPLPDAVVVTDPLAGQGLGIDGQPTGDPVPTPNVSVSSPPVDFPDDYAREDTLADLLKQFTDIEAPPKTEIEPYQSAVDQFTTVQDAVTTSEAEIGDALPLANKLSGLRGNGNCPVFEFPLPMGFAPIVVDHHCGFYTSNLIPAINWMLYMGTLWYLIGLYREETTRTI